jgi:HK97 family phage major capsid protein
MSTNLETQRATALKSARSILNSAAVADRDLTADEQAQISRCVADVKALDAAQIKGRAQVQSVLGLWEPGDSAEEDHSGSGSKLFSPEDRAGLVGAAKSRTTFRGSVNQKATLTSGALVPASGSDYVPGLYPSGVFPLASLFPNEPASGPVVRAYSFTAGSAAVVAEGAQKPDAGIQIAAVDVTLSKLAAYVKFTDEMTEDAAYLIGYLEQEVRAALQSAENALIVTSLTASGIGTDTSTAALLVDKIGTAIATQEAASGLTPSVVIANPVQVAALRALKASTAGSYVADPWAAGPAHVHGLTLVSTPAAAAGTTYVVSSQALTIYRRSGISAELGRDAGDFTKNLTTMVCEERMASFAARPSGITKITVSG